MGGLALGLDEAYGKGSEEEHDACKNQHHRLIGGTVGGRGKDGENGGTENCGYNLRQADGAVEEAEIGAHVPLACQGVGEQGERIGQGGSPCTAYQDEREEEHVGVVNEI